MGEIWKGFTRALGYGETEVLRKSKQTCRCFLRTLVTGVTDPTLETTAVQTLTQPVFLGNQLFHNPTCIALP